MAVKLASNQRELSDNEILLIAEDFDTIRIIGKPKFCTKYNISNAQLVYISEKVGVEIPQYRTVKSSVDIEGLKKIIHEAKSVNDLKYTELSKQFGIHVSTVKRIVYKERPEFKGQRSAGHSKLGSMEEIKKATELAIRYHKQHPEITYKDLCKKYKISYCTLKRHLQDDVKKSIEAAPEVAVTKDYVDSTPHMNIIHRGTVDLVEVEKADYIITAALVAKRHDYPTELSVFDHDLDENEMFNYRLQNEIVDKFIDQWIPFIDGKPAKKLEVFVSGIACCISTLVARCFERGVNLTLWHYDNSLCKYIPQTVVKDKPMAELANSKFYNTITKSSRFGGLFTYHCNFEKIDHLTSGLYMVRKYTYPTPTSQNFNKVEYCIINGMEHIWNVFGQFIMELKEENRSGKVVITPFKLDREGDILYEPDVGHIKVNLIAYKNK